jgi:hypothetical protein
MQHNKQWQRFIGVSNRRNVQNLGAGAPINVKREINIFANFLVLADASRQQKNQ